MHYTNNVGFIYFLYDGNSVKVGFTTKAPEERLNEIQTGNPNKLKLIGHFPGTIRDEKEVHKRWEVVKAKGGSEWFNVNEQAALDMIQKMYSRYTVLKK